MNRQQQGIIKQNKVTMKIEKNVHNKLKNIWRNQINRTTLSQVIEMLIDDFEEQTKSIIRSWQK